MSYYCYYLQYTACRYHAGDSEVALIDVFGHELEEDEALERHDNFDGSPESQVAICCLVCGAVYDVEDATLLGYAKYVTLIGGITIRTLAPWPLKSRLLLTEYCREQMELP